MKNNIQKTFRENLREFKEIFKLLLSEDYESSNVFYPKKAERYVELLSDIRNYLLENPGDIINLPGINPKADKALIDFIWKISDDGATFDEFFFDKTDSGQFLVHNYIKAVKELKPIYVNIPEEDIYFQRHLKESINCYVSGNHLASVILSFSVLEGVISNELEKRAPHAFAKLDHTNSETKVVPAKMKELIRKAYHAKIITSKHYDRAIQIYEVRNSYVHDTKTKAHMSALDVIYEVIDIIEYVYGRNE